ncbi:amino-acid N-acetyltransferase [Leucobacter chinensis]|uniref:amino-acid N-acetyltransferase n=1 Tax=Leucobacter chinensis TaxID=2851010 RepID=UPI001C219CCA|nr:amino-acid N-acetyltransferase [Leucobacter chinensis]
MNTEIIIRPARTTDVRKISELMEPLVARRILLGKDLVVLYEQVQEFLVATDQEGEIIGFGALHPMWEHLGEIRTIASVDSWLGKGVGSALMRGLEVKARDLGLSKLFCLTFETEFFTRHGFTPLDENDTLVEADVYAELLRSPDDGVAEFLDLARVKQNTLGNTRMLKRI